MQRGVKWTVEGLVSPRDRRPDLRQAELVISAEARPRLVVARVEGVVSSADQVPAKHALNLQHRLWVLSRISGARMRSCVAACRIRKSPVSRNTLVEAIRVTSVHRGVSLP